MKKHNFYAGPSILPQFTIENTAKAVLDLNGIGLSVMEISHRSKDFMGYPPDYFITEFTSESNRFSGRRALFELKCPFDRTRQH